MGSAASARRAEAKREGPRSTAASARRVGDSEVADAEGDANAAASAAGTDGVVEDEGRLPTADAPAAEGAPLPVRW